MRFQANRLGRLQHCAVAAISAMHQAPCLAHRKIQLLRQADSYSFNNMQNISTHWLPPILSHPDFLNAKCFVILDV